MMRTMLCDHVIFTDPTGSVAPVPCSVLSLACASLVVAASSVHRSVYSSSTLNPRVAAT